MYPVHTFFSPATQPTKTLVHKHKHTRALVFFRFVCRFFRRATLVQGTARCVLPVCRKFHRKIHTSFLRDIPPTNAHTHTHKHKIAILNAKFGMKICYFCSTLTLNDTFLPALIPTTKSLQRLNKRTPLLSLFTQLHRTERS